MTARLFTAETTSYSTRACRCGHAMHLGRFAEDDRACWQCASCGRSKRR